MLGLDGVGGAPRSSAHDRRLIWAGPPALGKQGQSHGMPHAPRTVVPTPLGPQKALPAQTRLLGPLVTPQKVARLASRLTKVYPCTGRGPAGSSCSWLLSEKPPQHAAVPLASRPQLKASPAATAVKARVASPTRTGADELARTAAGGPNWFSALLPVWAVVGWGGVGWGAGCRQQQVAQLGGRAADRQAAELADGAGRPLAGVHRRKASSMRCVGSPAQLQHIGHVRAMSKLCPSQQQHAAPPKQAIEPLVSTPQTCCAPAATSTNWAGPPPGPSSTAARGELVPSLLPSALPHSKSPMVPAPAGRGLVKAASPMRQGQLSGCKPRCATILRCQPGPRPSTHPGIAACGLPAVRTQSCRR